MTSVGRRPTLDELILALHAISRVEADADTLDPSKEAFRVVLTFQREQCPEDWREGQPKPTWLFEQIIEELRAWRQQQVREEQWVSKEDQHGTSINTLMAHYHEELKKASAAAPENIVTRMQKRIAADTIMRLKELKERREAGGVYSATENRRDRARQAWMEDEFEAPRREQEQRQQRARANPHFTDFTYTEGPAWFGADDAAKAWDAIFGAYSTDQQRRQDPQKPQAGNKRPWHVILGVSVKASKKEITKAYRGLAARYHPDRYKETDAHAKMAEINTARDEGLGGIR
jgi:DnaJ-domain-containing protein 1